jgi:hypothetical protein
MCASIRCEHVERLRAIGVVRSGCHLASDIRTAAPNSAPSTFEPDELRDVTMSGRVPGGAREDVDTRGDFARRDDCIVEVERSQRCLQRLFDSSALLTRFSSFERTVAEVLVLIADALPLRGATVTLETGLSASIVTWQAPDENGRRLEILNGVVEAHGGRVGGECALGRGGPFCVEANWEVSDPGGWAGRDRPSGGPGGRGSAAIACRGNRRGRRARQRGAGAAASARSTPKWRLFDSHCVFRAK